MTVSRDNRNYIAGACVGLVWGQFIPAHSIWQVLIGALAIVCVAALPESNPKGTE